MNKFKQSWHNSLSLPYSILPGYNYSQLKKNSTILNFEGLTMAYSTDLRNKALNYYEQCKNISQTAATFNLSRNTLYLWIRLKKQTGSLKHQVTGLNAVKLDRQKLAQYVGQHPDAYLHEIAKHFDCTAAAVCYALKQMGMTRKKRPPLTKNKTRPK